ncbi:MAG: glycosyltransferase family 4 protein [Nitrospirae bacterium]|nr:glycosyltransferase family 4 protein [Nitrospirota bacterium]
MEKVMHIQFWGNVNSIIRGSVDLDILTICYNMKRFLPIVASSGIKNGTTVNNGVIFHNFKEDLIKNRIFNKILNLKSFTFSYLINIIKIERPEILHLHNRHNLADAIVGKLPYSPKIICHYHRYFSTVPMPRTCDLLLTVSNSVKESIVCKTGTTKIIKAIDNPLSYEVINLKKKILGKGREEQENGFPIFMYPGGRQQHKGFNDLMKATAILNTRGIKFRLYLAGPNLEGYTPPFNNIENLGLLPPEDYLRKLEESVALVLPSLKEPFGLAIIEAMYLKKLVIATCSGGSGEYLNSENSIIVNPNDPVNLSIGLMEAINNVQRKSKEKQEKAFKDSKKFHPDIVTTQLETLYTQLINNTVNV